MSGGIARPVLAIVAVGLGLALTGCGGDGGPEQRFGTDHHNTEDAESAYMQSLLLDQPGFDFPTDGIDLNEEVNIIGEEVLIDSGYLSCDQMQDTGGFDKWQDSFETLEHSNDAWNRLPATYNDGGGIPDNVHSPTYSRLLAWNVLYRAIGAAAAQELCPEPQD